MKANKAKKKGYTHYGRIYSTRCYIKYYDDGFNIRGVTLPEHWLICFLVWIQCNVYDPNDGAFVIEEYGEL